MDGMRRDASHRCGEQMNAICLRYLLSQMFFLLISRVRAATVIIHTTRTKNIILITLLYMHRCFSLFWFLSAVSLPPSLQVSETRDDISIAMYYSFQKYCSPFHVDTKLCLVVVIHS